MVLREPSGFGMEKGSNGMKWQAGVSVVFVAAVFITANLVNHDREEKKAQDLFSKAVREGDRAYGEACGACHGRYDPRFHMFEEWNRILEDTGCPAVRVDLPVEVRDAIRDFLRAKAAPTEAEASTVQDRERSHAHADSVARGAEVYKKACAGCHEHPYFTKTRTASGWAGALDDLGALHRDAGEPVSVDGKDARNLRTYLEAGASGKPSDAQAIRTLIASGKAVVEAPAETAPTKVRWVRDHGAGLKEALERKVPVIIDVTDLSGG